MKLTFALLSSIFGASTASSPASSISATSKIGQKVLSKARRLEDNEVDYTWVANMSLKFQGCYHTSQWNDEADDEDDVRISTQKLVRFRLCPTEYCSMTEASGCSAGYGDYIIDMETYLEAYLEAVQQDQEYNCKYEEEYGDCGCDDENADDGFDEDICRYECYMGKGMEYCVDKNPYEEEGEEEEEEEWEMREYAECKEYEFKDNNNNRRKLEEEAEYFIGAYCSENGGKIFLGLFTDDTCSQFADSYGGAETFATLSYGKSLPYSDTTMIGSECMSCMENQEDNDDDEDAVKESCEMLYQQSGKCEANLGSSSPNNYGCNFMEGIKIVRKNGAVVRGAATKNTSASIFIGLFACSFVLLGGYVYYLKTKLDRAKINLSE